MKNFLLHNYGERDLVVAHGEGSWVWDDKGNRYLDCVAGVAVNAFGHGFEPVLAAIREQLACYLHASNLYLLPTQMELGAALCQALKMDKVFFCNSGTEANEGALKFARRFWLDKQEKAGGAKSGDAPHASRFEILSFTNSFHGRTYGSMAATGQEKIRKGFGPLPEGFKVLPINDAEALRAAIGPKTAAILFEPILAEGGIISLQEKFVKVLQEAQDQGILLIADEIQTGLGRTGTLLASWNLGSAHDGKEGKEGREGNLALSPDIITLAKPLGGGLPLGAVLMKEKIAEAIHVGDHGSTFGGNPVACAAGLAILKALTAEGFLADMQMRMEILHRGLIGLVEKKSQMGIVCGAVLGKGFLTGFKYGGDLAGLLAACRKEGLLVHRAGADVLRLLPPLNISREEIAEIIDRLDRAMIK